MTTFPTLIKPLPHGFVLPKSDLTANDADISVIPLKIHTISRVGHLLDFQRKNNSNIMDLSAFDGARRDPYWMVLGGL